MFGRKSTTTESAAERKGGNGKAEENSGFEPLWQPTETRTRKAVEQLLLERKHITEDHLLQARQVAGQTPGKSLAQILLGMNVASEAQILSALAETLELPFETPNKETIDSSAFGLLNADYMRKHMVLALRFEGDAEDQRGKTLVIGM